MVKVRSFNKKPGAVLARRSGPFASPRSSSNSNCDVTYGELEGADDGAEAVADESVAAAGAAPESGAEAAAAESVAAGVAVVSVLAQAASASAATRALRTSFVFIELYPEKEKGKR
jgi:hypothetical protein